LHDVQHQGLAIERLRRALASRRVPHAYLFAGPEGVGKEMLATRLAQLLLCTGHHETGAAPPDEAAGLFGALFEPAATTVAPASSRIPVPAGPNANVREEACGRCIDCTLMIAGNHPDYHRIHRALAKLHPDKEVRTRKAIDLSVEVVRQFLLGPIALRPSRGRAKVFVICEADRLNVYSMNALLKTLEEPPGDSYLILLAPHAEAVTQTIRSRCQLIPFGTLPREFVVDQLRRRKGLPQGSAVFIAELAQGSLGEAIRLAEAGIHNHLPAVLSAVEAAPRDALRAGSLLLQLAEELAPSAKEAQDEEDVDANLPREARGLVLAMLSAVLRDVQRAAVRSTPAVIPNEPRLAQWAALTSSPRIGQAIRSVALAEYQIGQNANKNLLFDAVGVALGEAFSEPAGV